MFSYLIKHNPVLAMAGMFSMGSYCQLGS